MKKLIASVLFSSVVAVIGFGDIIYPDGKTRMEEPYQVRKLGRGINNVVTAPFEIPKAVFDMGYNEGIDNPQQFSVGAIVRGPLNAVHRFQSGLHDMFYWGENDKDALFHMEPAQLSPLDLVPGYSKQFNWETIDTSALKSDNIPLSSSW